MCLPWPSCPSPKQTKGIINLCELTQSKRDCLDNGSTHAPKQLLAWLNQKQVEFGWTFTVQAVWLPKYASWLDQLEIWFSILQRKLLTPNDFPNLETLQQRLLDFITHYNLSAKPINWSYTVAQMENKFATNLWKPVLSRWTTLNLTFCKLIPTFRSITYHLA